jgi:L-cystine uptake protein TcyP (sodium:dicarboxylate symporter family)
MTPERQTELLDWLERNIFCEGFAMFLAVVIVPLIFAILTWLKK